MSDILTEDEKIIAVGENIETDFEGIDCSGKYIIPGFVDVHTHGRTGYDFNYITPDALVKMRRSYAERGTTTIMATLASAPLKDLFVSIEILNNSEIEGGIATVEGVHFEGRYLNPACRGAHALELLAPLDADELTSLIDAVTLSRVHVSAALELASDSFYSAAKKRGATLGMAHSDATYAEAMLAVEKGADSFTHTFNAMKKIHHREPGNISASLLSDAYTEIICDGEHVHPAMINMTHRLKSRGKLVLITDSMEGAGCPDGEYAIAGQKVIVKEGRAVNIDGALAGSTLDMMKALENYMSFCSLPLEKALPAATINPAKMVKLDSVCGQIKEGRRADMIILDNKDTLETYTVIAAGERV